MVYDILLNKVVIFIYAKSKYFGFKVITVNERKGRQMNILVCDDDKEIAGAIEIYLKNEGYDVFKAYDGMEALEIVESKPIHLIIMCDISTMTGTIEEELSGYGFTLAAIADNPERTVIDPYKGLDDIKNKLIRSIGDADELFKAEPIRMLQAMRYVSDLGFDLQKGMYEAIVRNWRLLLNHSIAPIRQELELIMVGTYTGKALNMMASTGLMAAIFGEEVSKKMTAGEMQAFVTLCDNIDKTMPLRMRRLGLLYTIFNEKRGLEAISRMNFDINTESHLKDAMHEMIKIQFLANDVEFKRYLFEHGLKRYNYVHNLSKAQRIVYDQSTTKIEARNHFMHQIKENNEAVFIEDLLIDGNDIMEAGITDNPDEAENLLHLVIAKVHQDCRNNDRAYLLKMAKLYQKHKWRANSRYVHWQK